MLPDIAIRSIDIDNRRVKEKKINSYSRRIAKPSATFKAARELYELLFRSVIPGIDEKLKARRDASGVRLTGEKYFH